MESLEPYDFKDAVPFKSAYLAGYVADRYDVDQDECMKRAKKRIRRSTEDSFRETVNGYYALSTQSSTINIRIPGTSYASVSSMASEYYVERTEVHICHERTEWKRCRDLLMDEGTF